MKQNIAILLLLLFLSACQKEYNNEPEVTIDYENFGYAPEWTEISSKTENSDWKSIVNGESLTFFSDSIDIELGIPYHGVVVYMPSINISIKSNTYLYRTDSTFEFYQNSATTKTDTVVLNYELIENSVLVITDNNVTPTLSVKYKRKK